MFDRLGRSDGRPTDPPLRAPSLRHRYRRHPAGRLSVPARARLLGRAPSGTEADSRAHRPVALVTGASSGIGAAVAEELAADGSWRLLLNGRDGGRLEQVATRTGGVPLAADLADARAVPHAAGRGGPGAQRQGGRAGGGCGHRLGGGSFAAMPPEDIDEVLALNLNATLHLVRLLLPGMVDRRCGQVVLIGSMAGSVGVRGEAVYSATKAGLAAFADSLRYELAPSGVGVSMVLPGVVDTPFFQRRGAPYRRDRPRPVPATRVAEAVCRALRTGRPNAYVPSWMAMPAWLHGTAPGVFRSLAQRFG
ncbi:SDR family NAD(P)-dependent oxidoreductase [Streptomyces sp. GKU 257-1]|nr:SDR family NAD(P)-dependent oxidoreductase [Streptomyces sp. GKU 257-1]